MSEVFYRVCEADPPVPSQDNATVPPEFDAWFAQACDPNPAKRFRTARELAAALARAHAEYTDACLDLTPSLTTFVEQRRSAKVRVAAAPVSVLRALFDLDEPLGATSA
jgi:eukaryotic-like serine/threonine-protein kinase